MQLTKRDKDIIIFALNFLRSNLDDLEQEFSEPGVHLSVALPSENELDNICAKLERTTNG